MSAVAKIQAKMSIIGGVGSTGPLDVLHSLTALEWAGPVSVVIPNGTSVQSIAAIGAAGLSLITSMLITSDQVVTVFYNASINGIIINPNGFNVFSDVTITAVAISNNSGVPAIVTYLVAGS